MRELTLKEIQEGIDFIKTDPAVREAYMTLGEYIKYEREEAAEEAAAEANARADKAEADAANANSRADRAEADAANANSRADKAEAEIERLKAELQKYKEPAVF